MRFVAAFLAITVLCSLAQARIIDDYSQGTINIIAGASPVTQESNGLDAAHTIGGSRRATAFGAVILRINHPSPAPVPNASFDQGIVGLNGYGEFIYGNSSPLNVNLNDDGAKEFRVTLSGTFRAEYLQKAVLALEGTDGMGSPYTASKTFGEFVTNSGNLITGHIPFSVFADVSNISKITLRFNGASGVSGSPPFTVRSFVTAVPEPTMLSMALAAAIAIGLKRRRVSACV